MDGLFVLLYATFSPILFVTAIVLFIAKHKKFSEHLNKIIYLYGLINFTYFVFWQANSFSTIILSTISLLFGLYIILYMFYKKYREARYT